MRATEIIRDLLDLLDKIDNSQKETEETYYDDESRRMNQVDDFTDSCEDAIYANEPNEVVGGIEVVTKLAGGGWQEPKHPADIRGDSVRVYGGN